MGPRHLKEPFEIARHGKELALSLHWRRRWCLLQGNTKMKMERVDMSSDGRGTSRVWF